MLFHILYGKYQILHSIFLKLASLINTNIQAWIMFNQKGIVLTKIFTIIKIRALNCNLMLKIGIHLLIITVLSVLE